MAEDFFSLSSQENVICLKKGDDFMSNRGTHFFQSNIFIDINCPPCEWGKIGEKLRCGRNGEDADGAEEDQVEERHGHHPGERGHPGAGAGCSKAESRSFFLRFWISKLSHWLAIKMFPKRNI